MCVFSDQPFKKKVTVVSVSTKNLIMIFRIVVFFLGISYLKFKTYFSIKTGHILAS